MKLNMNRYIVTLKLINYTVIDTIFMHLPTIIT